MEDKKPSYDIAEILQEMREEYWQGLSEVEEAHGEFLECITFTMGGELFGFETSAAAEVIRIPKLVRVPRVQQVIAGVFNLRGEILAAVDVRSLLGLPPLPFTSAGRIIVVKGSKFQTGLLVENVKGVEPLPLETLEPVVRSLGAVQRELIQGQVRHGEQLVILLDVARLLESPEIMVDHK